MASAAPVLGTCLRMCPEEEETTRVECGLVHPLERRKGSAAATTTTDDNQLLLVKKFSRSAAGDNVCKSCDLRPPLICYMTVRYIVQELLVAGKMDETTYDFVFDRLRSVRQDLSVQQVRDSGCAEVLEVCVRFHLLAGYQLKNHHRVVDPLINFAHSLECLKEALILHRHLQLNDGVSAEMTSAYLLLNLGSQHSISWCFDHPLRNHPAVVVALQMNLHYLQRNFVRVFRLSCRLSILPLLAFHWKLPQLLAEMLAVMCVAYNSKIGNYPVSHLSRLCNMKDSEVVELCQRHQVQLMDNKDSIRFSKSSFVSTSKSVWPRFSIIEVLLDELDLENFFLQRDMI